MVREHASLMRQADWIVVDPPRKGLDETVVSALCQSHNHHQEHSQQQVLVYVSCGFKAFVRDFEKLTGASNSRPWRLHQAEGHILFPGSDAIETLAFFIR